MDQPGLLYHYTTREAAFEHILPEGRLRLSSFDLMGDPVESKDWHFGAAYAPGATGHEGFERTFWRATALANEFKRHTKLLALSHNAPWETSAGAQERYVMGWSRARMWERYAESHRGVCLAFEAERLRSHVCEALETQGATRVLNRAVNYTLEGLAGETAATTLHLNEFDRPEAVEDALSAHFDKHGEELFFTKTLEWDSEFEYRFAGYTPGSTGYTYVSFGDALTHIYLGDRFPAVEIPGVLAYCEALELQPRQVRWENFIPWDFAVTSHGSIGDLRAAFNGYRDMTAKADGRRLPPFRPRPGLNSA